MKPYLFAVQRELDGVEVIAAVVQVDKVSEVSAACDEEGRVAIIDGAGDAVATAYAGQPVPDLRLCRWPTDNLAGKPVIKPLRVR